MISVQYIAIVLTAGRLLFNTVNASPLRYFQSRQHADPLSYVRNHPNTYLVISRIKILQDTNANQNICAVNVVADGTAGCKANVVCQARSTDYTNFPNCVKGGVKLVIPMTITVTSALNPSHLQLLH